jgi:hypothetical protein
VASAHGVAAAFLKRQEVMESREELFASLDRKSLKNRPERRTHKQSMAARAQAAVERTNRAQERLSGASATSHRLGEKETEVDDALSV